MNKNTKIGLEILQAAVLVGLLANLLLRETPWGLNVLMFVGVFVAGMLALMKRNRNELLTLQNFSLMGAMVFFAAMFVLRDSEQLLVFDTLAIIAAMSVLVVSSFEISAKTAGVSDYIKGFLGASLSSLMATLALIFADIKWKTLPTSGKTKILTSVLRGILIATPIILVIGGLFMAADAAYQGMIQRIFNVDADVIVSHFFLTGIFTWLTAGFFHVLFLPIFGNKVDATPGEPEKKTEPNISNSTSIFEHLNRSEEPNKPDEKPVEATNPQVETKAAPTDLFAVARLGIIENVIIFGLLDLLFLSFVIVQVPYLFGGMELVQTTPDFKLAEYARRGFGELITVAALVLPILLAGHWLLKRENPVNEKLFKVLAFVQIGLLFVIMLSAAQRLVLLTGNLGYGMTSTRFYPMVVMIWLAIVFVWFGVTVLRNKRQYFAWGALWSAFFVLGATNLANPDGIIAETNVRLMKEGREFDTWYNFHSLSDDAVPALSDAMEYMNTDQRCALRFKIGKVLAEKNGDLRTWNLARQSSEISAQAAMEKYQAEFEGCTLPNHSMPF